MNSKQQYYEDHPCPYWADEEQWARLLEKVIFMPDGSISFKGLSVNEVKILEGFSFADVLKQESVGKVERDALLKLQKLGVFSNGRKKGSLGKEAKLLVNLIRENPDLRNNEIARKAVDVDPEIFKQKNPKTLETKISRLRNPK